ncbi:hypothetical protein ACEZCY_36205 [Streptacidiphilus sp. N1-12]|uniref:Uncharacterized protein n=1 Tax=Streptacidiphilus alkalitolerans TaxID=3342712 RepID=A0ABV6XCV0_9ACTN
MEPLPIVRPGERVVARSDGKGGLILGVEKIRGRSFVASAELSGYVLDARLLMDVLGSLKMPGSWFQVWCKLTAAQNARQDPEEARAARGYVRISQRTLQERCSLAPASVNEASQFFSHIGWMRSARRGVLQLNPWLTVAGTSGEQEQWQGEWNAQGGPVCVIPAPDYPTLWRAERAKEKELAAAARRSEKVVPLRGARRPARRASA